MKLPRIESLIILVFFGCVVLWGISKCSSRRSALVSRIHDLTEEDTEDRPVRRDTIRVPADAPVAQTPVNTTAPVQQPVSTTGPAPAPAATPTPAPSVIPGTKPARPTISNQTETTAPATGASSAKYSTLYVTIDGLKVRKQPGLKGELVETLKLYDPVTFLNKKSEKAEEISLGLEKVTDYWVKIRTASGKEGWVFGAGVYYYKMKRKGVL